MRGGHLLLVAVGWALACGGVERRPRPDPIPRPAPSPAEPAAPTIRVEELDYAWGSAVRGDDGKYTIETSGLRDRERGNRVTVLPLGGDAEPFVLPVADIGSYDGCGDVPETVVQLKPFLPAQFGLPAVDRVGVLLLHPEVAHPKVVPIPEQLPARVPRREARTAVNVTGDGAADLLHASYCCDDDDVPSDSPECEFDCTWTWYRTGSEWEMGLSEGGPC